MTSINNLRTSPREVETDRPTRSRSRVDSGIRSRLIVDNVVEPPLGRTATRMVEPPLGRTATRMVEPPLGRTATRMVEPEPRMVTRSNRPTLFSDLSFSRRPSRMVEPVIDEVPPLTIKTPRLRQLNNPLVPTASEAIQQSRSRIGEYDNEVDAIDDNIPYDLPPIQDRNEVLIRPIQDEVTQSLIYSDVVDALKESLEVPIMYEGIWDLIHGDVEFTTQGMYPVTFDQLVQSQFNDIRMLRLVGAMIRIILQSGRSEIISSAFGQPHQLRESSTSTQYLEYYTSGLFKNTLMVKYDASEDRVCRATLIGLLYANRLRKLFLNYSYTFDPWITSSYTRDPVYCGCTSKNSGSTIRGITERIEGPTLSAAIRGAQIDRDEVISIIFQLTLALEYGFEEIDFRHNHLTLSNVILRQVNNIQPGVNVQGVMMGNSRYVEVDQYLIRSRFIPTIINYSHATIGKFKGCVDRRYSHLNPSIHELSDIFGVIVDMAKAGADPIIIPILRYFVIDADENNLDRIDSVLHKNSVDSLSFKGLINHLINLPGSSNIIINTDIDSQMDSIRLNNYSLATNNSEDIDSMVLMMGIDDNYLPETVLGLELSTKIEVIPEVLIREIYNDAIESVISIAGDIKDSLNVGNIERALYLRSRLLTYVPTYSVKGRNPVYDRVSNHYTYLITPIINEINRLLEPHTIAEESNEYPPNLTIVIENEKKVPRYLCVRDK
jgi:hypothetical protein